MKRFAHIHSSSRWDRGIPSLRNAIEDYIADADIITFTEVSSKRRKAVLKSYPGWMGVHSPIGAEGDCGIMFKRERFALIHQESFKMGKKPKAAGNTTRVGTAYIVVLRDKTNGRKIVVGSAHFPASVERAIAKRRFIGKAATWLSSVLAMRARMNRVRKQYKAKGQILAADWNIDFKKKWARSYIKTLFPKWKLTWRAPWNKRGTHGRRLIDASLIWGRLKAVARPYKDDDSSDHAPYIENVYWV